MMRAEDKADPQQGRAREKFTECESRMGLLNTQDPLWTFYPRPQRLLRPSPDGPVGFHGPLGCSLSLLLSPHRTPRLLLLFSIQRAWPLAHPRGQGILPSPT